MFVAPNKRYENVSGKKKTVQAVRALSTGQAEGSRPSLIVCVYLLGASARNGRPITAIEQISER